MEDIKVGEYVRSKEGIIDKVRSYSFSTNIWNCENGMCIDECNCIGTHLESITKHSFNLIDLIEVRRLCKWKKSKCIKGRSKVIWCKWWRWFLLYRL